MRVARVPPLPSASPRAAPAAPAVPAGDALSWGEVSHGSGVRKCVLASAGTVPCLQYASFAVFPPGGVASAHTHADMHESFICVRGRGVARVDDREIELTPGTLLVVHAGERHEIVNTDQHDDMHLYYFGIVPPAPASS